VVSVVRSLSLLVLVCLVLDIMSLFSLVVQVFILVAFLVAGVLCTKIMQIMIYMQYLEEEEEPYLTS
jgi:hypothetical protein